MRAGSLLVFATVLLPWVSDASAVDEWRGVFEAPSVSARGTVGVTSPLAVSIPEWSRANATDLGFLSSNPALLALIPAERGRLVPLAVSTLVGGSQWNFEQAAKAASRTPREVLATMGGASSPTDEVQRARLEANAYGMADGLGLAMGYLRSRAARLRSDGVLEYAAYQEGRVQVGGAGYLFDTPRAGTFSLGFGLKAVFRLGDEAAILSQASTQDDLLSSGDKMAGALGMDFGLHYRLPPTWTGAWNLEAGFAWHDVGESSFLFGGHTTRGARFAPYPNNLIFGLGAAGPSFWHGTRAAFRFELSEWGRRDATLLDKTSLSAELRLPALLSVQAGLRGSGLSAGASLRFTALEIEFAARSQSWGREQPRSAAVYVTELRAVY